MRQSEGRWTERAAAFAGIRVLCDGCYQQARERNWKQDDQGFTSLLDEACVYFNTRQDQLSAQYGLGKYPHYDWNQESGHLIFSDNGQARVIADIQFVGSLSTRSNTWLWSWGNQSILEPVKQRVREVRALGEDRRYLKLASACWPAEESDGWEMAAITAYVLGAAGVYRSPDDRGFSFLVMTDVQLVQ